MRFSSVMCMTRGNSISTARQADISKIDAVGRSAKASFCVIDQDSIRPEKYTMYFRSVIVFGRIRVITDEKKREPP